MLYDPKWKPKTKADPFTMQALVAWLEQQPKAKMYDYWDRGGRCLYGQYMAAVGVPWAEAKLNTIHDPYREFRHAVYDIACAGRLRSTFGAALNRARAVL